MGPLFSYTYYIIRIWVGLSYEFFHYISSLVKSMVNTKDILAYWLILRWCKRYVTCSNPPLPFFLLGTIFETHMDQKKSKVQFLPQVFTWDLRGRGVGGCLVCNGPLGGRHGHYETVSRIYSFFLFLPSKKQLYRSSTKYILNIPRKRQTNYIGILQKNQGMNTNLVT